MATYSLERYRRILRAAKAGGRAFSSFRGSATGRRVHLRHDVDYSLTLALEMARADAEEGCPATFFVLVRTSLYNPLSTSGRATMREIASLGHEIGLHFAPVATDHSDAELEKRLTTDFKILAGETSAAPVFAWHNPESSLIDRWMGRPEVQGLVNVYSRSWMKEMPYLSDSNLRHGAEAFEEKAAGADEAIQLAFHPLNWVIGGDVMEDVLAGSWPEIIRSCETEFLTNRVYSSALPSGIPGEVLTELASRWRNALARK